MRCTYEASSFPPYIKAYYAFDCCNFGCFPVLMTNQKALTSWFRIIDVGKVGCEDFLVALMGTAVSGIEGNDFRRAVQKCRALRCALLSFLDY